MHRMQAPNVVVGAISEILFVIGEILGGTMGVRQYDPAAGAVVYHSGSMLYVNIISNGRIFERAEFQGIARSGSTIPLRRIPRMGIQASRITETGPRHRGCRRGRRWAAGHRAGASPPPGGGGHGFQHAGNERSRSHQEN